MRLLLDTHIFLWYVTANPKMPANFRLAIQEPANEPYLSVASIWEAIIKYQLKKLPLPVSPTPFFEQLRIAHGIASLPIEEGAMRHLEGLPPLHRDPFDRILVAQALQHGLTVVTVDHDVLNYPVSFLPVLIFAWDRSSRHQCRPCRLGSLPTARQLAQGAVDKGVVPELGGHHADQA